MHTWIAGRTGILHRFDASSRTSEVRVDLGHPVCALASLDDAILAVGGGRRGRFSIVSAATATVSTQAGGLRMPVGVVPTRHGPRVLCAGRNPRLVDPLARTGWPAGAQAQAVAAGFGSLWVLRQSRPGRLVRIDPADGSVEATVEVHRDPQAIFCGESAVWVATDGPGGIDRVDPETMTVTATVETARQPTAVIEAHGRVWVTHGSLPLLTVLATEPFDVDTTIRVGAGSFGIAAAGEDLWLTQTLAGKVAVVDSTRRGVRARFDLEQPLAIVATPG